MKRHESIVVLSREHHLGLLFCWKIRQGVRKQIAVGRMHAYVCYFWEQQLQPHFSEEESLLFAGSDDPLCRQALAEHQEIRQAIAVWDGLRSVSEEGLLALADLLDRHIRFEERILFPHLEQTLSEQVLMRIGVHLAEAHPLPSKDTYTDEFWV